jgi:hypothetical protein
MSSNTLDESNATNHHTVFDTKKYTTAEISIASTLLNCATSTSIFSSSLPLLNNAYMQQKGAAKALIKTITHGKTKYNYKSLLGRYQRVTKSGFLCSKKIITINQKDMCTICCLTV